MSVGAREGETPWLSSEEQQAWRSYLRATRQLEIAMDRDLVECGMTLADYEILSMLSEVPGARLRMSALADLVVQSRSRVTHTAARLERRGWVERQPCEEDQRGVELVLTDQGREALMAASHVHVRGVRESFVDVVGAEAMPVVGQALKRVHERIDAPAAAE